MNRIESTLARKPEVLSPPRAHIMPFFPHLVRFRGSVRFGRFGASQLFGLQERHEFSASEEKRVKRGYASFGPAYLETNPIIVCAFPSGISHTYEPEEIESGKQYSLLIVDGHHRVRFGPTRAVREFPAYILPVAQTLKLYEHVGSRESIESLQGAANAAIDSFSRVMPYYRGPRETTFDDEDLGRRLPILY